MQRKMLQEHWIEVESIPQTTPFMMSVALKFMIQEWPKRGLGDTVTRYFTWFDKDTGNMCYVRSEFDAQADFLSRKMLSHPEWALRVIADVEKWSKFFFAESKKFRTLRFAKFSNKQMLRAWQKPFRWHVLSHGVGASVSWQADAEKERVTKALIAMIDEQIRKNNLQLETPVAFSALSTPDEESASKREEKDLLRLVAERANINRIRSHAKKYEWLNYQYKGPAYDLTYFLNRIDGLKKAKTDSRRLLRDMNDRDRKVKAERRRLITALQLNQQQKKLIQMAQRMVFIKDFRKLTLYHGMYCYEPFFKEIGRRFGLSIDQVRAMSYEEIADALRTGDCNHTELNERLQFSIWHYDRKQCDVYTEAKAQSFLKRIRFEKPRKQKKNEFTGSCAYPGKVRGVVKIINVPEDMTKMRKGNILVAHNTNPNLVPAMKMASALISGAGGLTCHTAIVAREMRIPAIVGILGIDKMLKDGDQIEVDAVKGTVKII